jgi:hypothetical protein
LRTSGSRRLLPAPSPLRTVRATFTAHGSSISIGRSFWEDPAVIPPLRYASGVFSRLLTWVDASVSLSVTVICFSTCKDSPDYLAMKHQMDVGSLSRRVTFKPVSGPLQTGVRFFHPPLPASPWARLAARFPRLVRGKYGIDMFRSNTRIG